MSDDEKPADTIDERAARVLNRLGSDEEEKEEEGETESEKGGTSREGADAAAAKEGEEIVPPVSWSSEEKETFKKLPREAQAVVARREGERDRMLSQRAQDLAQRERALEEQRHSYAQRLDAFLAQARLADPLLGAGTQEDWARLARENPVAFAQRMTAMQHRGQQLAAAEGERRRLAEEHGRQFVAREHERLGQLVPEMRDPAQRQALMKELSAYLGEAGFTSHDLAGLSDHRTYLVALDALRYRKLMKAQKDAAAKKVVPAGKVQKPGAAPDGEPKSGRLAALKKAARKSGKLDDRAAYVLAALRDD